MKKIYLIIVGIIAFIFIIPKLVLNRSSQSQSQESGQYMPGLEGIVWRTDDGSRSNWVRTVADLPKNIAFRAVSMWENPNISTPYAQYMYPSTGGIAYVMPDGYSGAYLPNGTLDDAKRNEPHVGAWVENPLLKRVGW